MLQKKEKTSVLPNPSSKRNGKGILRYPKPGNWKLGKKISLSEFNYKSPKEWRK